MLADDTAGCPYDRAASSDLFAQVIGGGTVPHSLGHEAVAFLIGEETVRDKYERFFVNQLQSRVVCVDLVEIWV
jgi:hypothetical protein